MSNSNALSRPRFYETPGSSTGLLVSVILHSALLLLVIVGWHPERENRQVVKPSYIEATLLQMEPAITEPAPPREEAKPRAEEEARSKAEEQQRQEQLKQEQQKREQQAREKAEAEKRRQEQVKREQQARAEAEKKRQEELQRELERQEALKREAEKKRQEELRRQQMEEDLASALAREEASISAAENAQQVGTYSDYMRSLIAANWSRPPSARRDMQVELEILLGAAGRVTGVRVLKSSGNAAFDRSAEQAVLKVGQFTRLREMDPALYQEQFRRVILIFSPEDLRM